MASMKVRLIGHTGSQFLVPASQYLTDKYLPKDFDIEYHSNDLPIHDWSKFVAGQLSQIKDEFVILALDDYLLSNPLDMDRYNELLNRIKSDTDIVCARLCRNDFYKAYEYHEYGGNLIMLTDQAEYSATTQYCIWRKEYLIELLGQTTTPWDFEINGSAILNVSGKKVIGSLKPALDYPDESAISAKWGTGIRVVNNKKEDIDHLVEDGLLWEYGLIRK